MLQPLRRAVMAAILCVLAASAAFASEASDAYKEADRLAEVVERAATDEERAAAEKELRAYVERRSAALSAQKLSKMDTAYLGRMQSRGGMHAEAIATLEKAIADTSPTKYASHIHIFYVRALIAAGQPEKAFKAWETMAAQFSGDKNTKIAAMSVGLALRSARLWRESAKALDYALRDKDAAALKPLVHSLLMAGDRAGAVAAIEVAMEAAGEAGADEAHPILLGITKRFGETIDLGVQDYAPGPAPELEGKVVVAGFWNVSAGTLRWTMEVLQGLFDEFPPTSGVEVLAISTYYQKNPETGLFEDDMTPEVERKHGLDYRTQYGFRGQLAYVKDREALQALGCSAFPYLIVVGKDGRLQNSPTVNRDDPTELEVVRDIVRKALQ